MPLVLISSLRWCIGAVLGAINGLFVWKLNIPSIVVTLGTLTIYRGMAFVLSGGAWVNAHQMTAPFLQTPRQLLLGSAPPWLDGHRHRRHHVSGHVAHVSWPRDLCLWRQSDSRCLCRY